MTDTRKRLASTAASQSSAQKRNGHSARSLSSGSITPMEEEDDIPLRSTRFRNPLPPQKGPLFPDLPPKLVRPKPSPKASNTSTSQLGDSIDSGNIAGPSRLPGTPRKASTPEADKPTIPSGSGTSLTPPPPTSDDVEMVIEQEVKDEPETEDEKTPRQTRTRRRPSATPTGSATSERGASQVRRRRGEEQLLLDDHLLPEEMRRTGKMPGKRGLEKQEDEEPEEEEGGGDEVTRCVCQLEDGDPLMVACDKCNVWQHGPCVGIWADEEAPDEYFCERCRPDLHGPLRKWIRSRGRNIAHFIPPSPEDLKSLHSPHDKYPPSQSKRWKDKPKPPPRRKDPSPERPKKVDPPREKSLAKSEAPRSAGKERRMSHTRRISIDATSPQRDSRSPTAREPKKRSTMNSRDAMYEEEVKAALEMSRREMEPEETIPEVEAEEEKEEKKAKGKRKRDEDDPEPIHKVKHPNQYTYRPKSNIPIPSPARKAGTPTPQIPAPALHEHGTRRAGALANGAREAPFIAVSVTHLGWNLPEYLSSFSDILPTSNPTPLQVRSPRQFVPIPKNHFFNHKYGPFADIRDENGSLTLPPDPPERETTGQRGEAHTEPPARVKYPQRRITTGEIRKRVKHMQDFCTRVQVEERRRGERKGRIGIPEAERSEDIDMPEPESITISTSTGPSSAQLLAELTADLVDFQEKWATGGFAQNEHASWGGNSPVPPSSATFPSSGWPTSGLANVVSNDNTSEVGSAPVVGDEQVIMEQAEEPVEVYREGEVREIVATQAEVEAAEVIAGGMGIGLGISGGVSPGAVDAET